MLAMVVKKVNPSLLTQCYSCEEMHSVLCNTCDINREVYYICPSCKRKVNQSNLALTINFRIVCSECMRNIQDVNSISKTERTRILYHLGELD
jgi:hypothetical protein